MRNSLTTYFQNHPNQKTIAFIYIPLLIISAIAVFNLTGLIDSIRFFPSNDSYFEEAQNYVRGHGLTRTPWADTNYTVDYEPTVFQPPGFGILIYLVSLLGLPPSLADLWISRSCWILTPALLVFTLRPIIGLWPSILCAVLIASSPSYYLFSPGPSTEPVYNLLILLSIGIVIKNIDKGTIRSRLAKILGAGLLAGIAYAIRNVGLAYFLSLFSAIVVLVFLKSIKPRDSVKLSFWFLMGLAPVLIGLFLRNIALFNEALPYRINQGYFATPLVSLRVLIEAVLLDISGSRSISKLAWDYLPLLSITLPIFLSAIYFTYKQWAAYTLKEKFFILFSIFLLLSSSGMLVIAHTYHGLDPGDLIRHVFPFSWTLYPLLLIIFQLNKRGLGKAVFSSIGAIIIFGHLLFIKNDIQKTQDILSVLEQSSDITLAAQPITEKYKILSSEINFKISKDPDILDVVAGLPSDAFLISNVGGSLRRLSGRPVRTLDFNARNLQKTLSDIVQMAETVTTARAFYLIILPSNDIARSADNIHWQEKTAEILIPRGFSVVAKKTNIIVFSKPRKP